jgi:hypothetical protein
MIMDKYTRWYNHIVERARYRIIEDYTETHHIKPRSLGGSDEIDNLVALTAREHFICHWLLTKMTTGEDRYKMLNALRMMRAEKNGQQRYETAITSRVYESIKTEYARLQSERIRGEKNPMWGRTHTEEARKLISEKNTGKKLTEDQIARQVAAQTGRKRAPFTEKWRAKMAEKKKGENNPRYGVELSAETRRKIGDKIRGRKQTDEEKARRGAANKGKVKPKLLCPHCKQMIAVNTYPRWHGPNCAQAPR